ncbi:MAG: hypothetical protein R3345_08695 [Fulvivirga sp.]|nr:hypothetical protein [Fulvivirga sp.]
MKILPVFLGLMLSLVVHGQDMVKSDSSWYMPMSKKVDSIDNSTSLTVELLLALNRADNRYFHLVGELMKGAKVCHMRGQLFLTYPNKAIEIRKDGVILHKGFEGTCDEPVESMIYGTNRKYIEQDDGNMQISYAIDDVEHQTTLGELTVHVRQMKCEDTGTNPVTLVHDGQQLKLKAVVSLQFFEFDYNEDGSNELYLFSFAMCQERMKLYRVYD